MLTKEGFLKLNLSKFKAEHSLYLSGVLFIFVVIHIWMLVNILIEISDEKEDETLRDEPTPTPTTGETPTQDG